MSGNLAVVGGVVERGIQHDMHSLGIGIRHKAGESLHGSCSIGGGGTTSAVSSGHHFVDFKEIFDGVRGPRVVSRGAGSPTARRLPSLDRIGVHGLEPEGIDAHVAQGF